MSISRYLLFAIFVLQASTILVQAADASPILTDPTILNPGVTVSTIPNGFSSGAGVTTKLFDQSQSFDFTNGPSGILRERILQYSDNLPAHPYGDGLFFDFEITLSSGYVTSFIVSGYSGIEVSVKQCGISGCGGSGSDGISTTSASRTSDGDQISFSFGSNLNGTDHSSNLQLLTNATSFVEQLASFQDNNGDLFSIPVVTPAAAVPEPSTWTMLIIGFAGIGFIAYRRKSNAGTHGCLIRDHRV